jgi:nucleotide-binding universal stress UspA family protein
MYTSILVPLDGSEHAAKALPHAAGIAEVGEVVTLLSVIHPINELVGARQPELMSGGEKTEDMLAQEAYDDERSKARRTLSTAKESLKGEPFDVQVRLAEGDPAEQILKAAKDIDADLIVMTAYGVSASSTPAKAGVFGSVVDGVLRGARLPVLIVKPWE